MNIQDICIQGDPQRGKDIIRFFEVMGGVNRNNVKGQHPGSYYSLTANMTIAEYAIREAQTLIRLQPNSLLPENYHTKFSDGNEKGAMLNPNASYSLKLTESQFLALSGYKPEQKEQREIVGYRCPMDLWGGLIKAGMIYKQFDPAALYYFVDNGTDNALPAEIVEQWEPVYKEEKKPLFITEDGVPVYEGDEVYFVNENWNSGKETASALCNSHGVDPAKHFSTQTQAEKYIFNHKPVLLSYCEVQDWLGLGKPDSDKLKQLVESKLKTG